MMIRILILLISTVLINSSFAEQYSPDFRLPALDGTTFTLTEKLNDGPVLIDFWATWCKPCLQSMPHLENIHKEFAEKGLQTYAISIDNTRSKAKIKPFIKGKGYTFGVLLDTDQEVRKLFGGNVVPLTLLISKQGEILYRHLGYVPGDEDNLRKEVEALFRSQAQIDTSQKTAETD